MLLCLRSVGHDTYHSAGIEKSKIWGRGNTVYFWTRGRHGTGPHIILIKMYGKLDIFIKRNNTNLNKLCKLGIFLTCTSFLLLSFFSNIDLNRKFDSPFDLQIGQKCPHFSQRIQHEISVVFDRDNELNKRVGVT